ncbi:MAG: hypothetical protein IT181_00230 [Acidobacteria bacterium]|nr:hypothetical protein [Acidobacteriota bacterium]
MCPPRRLTPGLLATAVAACLLLAAPAHAQDTLVIYGRLIGALGNLGVDLGRAPLDADLPLAGGGRFSVQGLAITDRRTGQSAIMDPGSYLLDVDPVRPRVFVRSPGVLFSAISEVDATTGAARTLTLVGASQVPTSDAVRYAYSANRLYLDVTTDLLMGPPVPKQREVQVFDGSTGARLPGGFTFTALPLSPWLVTPEGDYAYVVEGASLVTIELATGARRTLTEPVTGLQWDPLNERLFVSVGGTLFVLTRQGDVLGSAAMGDCYGTAVSPHTGRLYVRRRLYSRFPPIYVEDLRVFDSRTYALLDRVAMPGGFGCDTRVFTAPGPPRQLQTRVAGHTVSLSWVNVAAASQFVLDVGVAPGRTDLSLFLGPENHASFAGVPSGVYYLRVRGGNEFGGGRASDEVRLVVP